MKNLFSGTNSPHSRSRTANSRRIEQSGHTFIELVIAGAIAAVLISAATPSLAGLYAQTQVTTTTNSLIQSLHLARTHAISRQRNVHVCHLNPDTLNSCDMDRGFNSTWSVGWLIFADLNGNRDLDTDDDVLQIVHKTNSANIVFNQRGRLRYFANGSARSAGFYVCDPQQKSFRHIYLLYTGRARVNETLSQTQKSICSSASS